MSNYEQSSTTCTFIPVYCFYDRKRATKVKKPVLIVDSNTFYLTAVNLDINPDHLTKAELKSEFLHAYHDLTAKPESIKQSLEQYDIFPKLISIMHTDEKEVFVYSCEFYDNTEPYYHKENRSQIGNYVSYQEGIEELIKDGELEPLTEKVLQSLFNNQYFISAKNNLAVILPKKA